jgi:hypothetical protein
MALVLKEELVLCCEGEADRQFIRKLIENRGLRPFDMPFPTNQLHGNKAFGGMLEAIRGDKANFPRIKGVLIVADSADDPATLFTDICSQSDPQEATAFQLSCWKLQDPMVIQP